MSVYAVQKLEVARRIGVVVLSPDMSRLAEQLTELAAHGVAAVVHLGPLESPAAAAIESDGNSQALYLVDETAGAPAQGTWIAPNVMSIANELRVHHAWGSEFHFEVAQRNLRVTVAPDRDSQILVDVPVRAGSVLWVDPKTLEVQFLE